MAEGAGRIRAWMHRHAPNREALAANRWLKPFHGHILRSELWRFTRRSVPRGVALGLLVGIFLLIPGIQIIAAVLFSLPVRANVPVAAAMTWLSNPFTTPFILFASIFVGERMLGLEGNVAAVRQLIEHRAPVGQWFAWLMSDAAPAMLVGLAVIAVVAAAVGYVVAAFGWRWWIAHKWRSRGHHLRRLTPDAG